MEIEKIHVIAKPRKLKHQYIYLEADTLLTIESEPVLELDFNSLTNAINYVIERIEFSDLDNSKLKSITVSLLAAHAADKLDTYTKLRCSIAQILQDNFGNPSESIFTGSKIERRILITALSVAVIFAFSYTYKQISDVVELLKSLSVPWIDADLESLPHHEIFYGYLRFTDVPAYNYCLTRFTILSKGETKMAQIPFPNINRELPAIEQRTFIYGCEADKLSDEQIFSVILENDNQIKALEAYDTKPKKLKTQIENLKAANKELAEYVDAR